jgi:hypothetical protein
MIVPTQPKTPQIPAGSHLAIPYQIIYLGVQEKTWQGNTNWRPEVNITFEFPNVKAEFEDKETKQMVVKPKVLSNTYTFSLGSKGNLLPIVEGIVGTIGEDVIDKFDLDSILGKPCLVQIELNGEYSNIKSTMLVPDGFPIPALYNKTRVLAWNDIGADDYAKLPEFLRKKIDYARKYDEKAQKANVVRVKPVEENVIEYGQSINADDIPF